MKQLLRQRQLLSTREAAAQPKRKPIVAQGIDRGWQENTKNLGTKNEIYRARATRANKHSMLATCRRLKQGRRSRRREAYPRNVHFFWIFVCRAGAAAADAAVALRLTSEPPTRLTSSKSSAAMIIHDTSIPLRKIALMRRCLLRCLSFFSTRSRRFHCRRRWTATCCSPRRHGRPLEGSLGRARTRALGTTRWMFSLTTERL